MKTNSLLLVVFVSSTFLLLTLPSCEKEGECDDIMTSSSDENESHNFGMNCMNCHVSSGEGEGCFTIAASVCHSDLLSPLTSGTVKLFTQANGGGTLISSIPIDANGNFYTTEIVDFSGLYAAITGPNGTTNFMSNPLSSGACDSCHGVSTSKLWSN